MKKTSFRNWVGSFLGGSLGILASGYIAPIALPFATFFGVIVGWWHKEILVAIGAGCARARAKRKDVQEASDSLLVLLAAFCGISVTAVMNAIDRIGQGRKQAASLGVRVAKATLRLSVRTFFGFFVLLPKAFQVVATAPARIRAWDRGHPMNRAIVVELLAGASTLTLCASSMYFLSLAGYIPVGPKDTPDSMAGVGIMFYMLGLGAYIGGRVPDKNSLRGYWHEYAILSRAGYFGLYVYYVLQFFRSTIGTIAFLAIFFGWMLVAMIGTLLCSSIVMGIALTLTFVYKTSRRHGHLLCLVSTLTITGIAWAIFHSRFDDAQMLWTVAFGSGMTAGAFTELLRILSFKLRVPLIRLEKEDWIMFVTDHVIMFFATRRHLAQVVRAIAFGTPVAAPVRVLHPELSLIE